MSSPNVSFSILNDSELAILSGLSWTPGAGQMFRRLLDLCAVHSFDRSALKRCRFRVERYMATGGGTSFSPTRDEKQGADTEEEALLDFETAFL